MKCSKQMGLLLMTIATMVHSVPSETESRYISEENHYSVIPLGIQSPENSHILSHPLQNFNTTHTASLAKYDIGNMRKITKIGISGQNSETMNTSVPLFSKMNSSNKMVNSQSSSANFEKMNHNSVEITKGTTVKSHKTVTKLPLIVNTLKITTPSTKKLVKIKMKVTTPRMKEKYSVKTKHNSSNIPHTPQAIDIKKPIIHKVKTKWSDSLTEVKQNWYEEGVPYPNPNPDISSSSPSFSLNEISSIAPIISDNIGVSDSGLTPEVNSHSPPHSISDVPDIFPTDVSSSSTVKSDILSVFNLDMVSDATKVANGDNSPCPTVHISSNVMNPQQRQGCSDLNLVINSHIHQNSAADGNRLPAVSTYDSLPGGSAEEPLAEAVEEEGIYADSVGTQSVAADPAVSADPGTGAVQSAAPATGGSGGSGGSGGNGDGGSWKFPDLRHLFEALGYIWNGLGYFFSFLRNPYLYIIPMLLFFLLGFFKVLALFPWWIPLLLLYLGIKTNSKPKQSLSFYQHIHKPVHHLDGWFWNQKTKTWQNVQNFIHSKKDLFSSIDYDNSDSLSTDLERIHGIYAHTDMGVVTSKANKRRYR